MKKFLKLNQMKIIITRTFDPNPGVIILRGRFLHVVHFFVVDHYLFQS